MTVVEEDTEEQPLTPFYQWQKIHACTELFLSHLRPGRIFYLPTAFFSQNNRFNNLFELLYNCKHIWKINFFYVLRWSLFYIFIILYFLSVDGFVFYYAERYNHLIHYRIRAVILFQFPPVICGSHLIGGYFALLICFSVRLAKLP